MEQVCKGKYTRAKITRNTGKYTRAKKTRNTY